MGKRLDRMPTLPDDLGNLKLLGDDLVREHELEPELVGGRSGHGVGGPADAGGYAQGGPRNHAQDHAWRGQLCGDKF